MVYYMRTCFELNKYFHTFHVTVLCCACTRKQMKLMGIRMFEFCKVDTMFSIRITEKVQYLKDKFAHVLCFVHKHSFKPWRAAVCVAADTAESWDSKLWVKNKKYLKLRKSSDCKQIVHTSSLLRRFSSWCNWVCRPLDAKMRSFSHCDVSIRPRVWRLSALINHGTI